MSAVLNNTRTEPHTPEVRRPVTPSNDKTTLEGHAIASNKWMQDRGEKDDEFGAWPLTKEDEEKVVKIVERTDSGSFPETPRKPSDSRTATPGSKRRRREEESNGASIYPTPATKETRDEGIFGNPSTSRRKLRGGMWDGAERSVLFSPAETPSPMRFKDASSIGPPPTNLTSPSKSNTGDLQPNYDITEDIMNLLKGQHIEEDVEAKLRQVLSRNALKISGIVKGRDITRVALRTKDTKIADLQQKIMLLEHKHDMDEAIIKRLREQNAG